MFDFFKKKTIKDIILDNDLNRLSKKLNSSIVNCKDSDGKTALFYALKANNATIVKLLLEHGAELHYGDGYNIDFYKDVIDTFNSKILTIFVDEGVVFPSELDGEPLLHYCIYRNCRDYNFLQKLIDNGLDINKLNSHGYSPLASSLISPMVDLSFIDMFIRNNVDVTYAASKNEKPFFCLINSKRSESEKIKILQVLIDSNFYEWHRHAEELIAITVFNYQSALFLSMLEHLLENSVINISGLDKFLTQRYFTPKQQQLLVSLNETKNLSLPISPEILINQVSTLNVDLIKESDVFECITNINIPIEEKKRVVEKCKSKSFNLNTLGNINHKSLLPLSGVLERNGVDKNIINHLVELINIGLPIESEEDSVLLYAANHHFIDVIDILLQKGADPFFVNSRGESLMSKLVDVDSKPSHLNFFNSFFQILKLLAKSLTSEQLQHLLYTHFLFPQSEKGECQQKTIMEWALMLEGGERRILIKYLLGSPCNWNIHRLLTTDKFPQEEPFLSHLISNDDDDLVRYFFNLYQDYTIPSEYPLFFYGLKQRMPLAILKKIIEHTDNINRIERVNYTEHNYYSSGLFNYLCLLSYLYRSCDEADYLELAQFLITKGADINESVEYLLLEKDTQDILVESSFLLESFFSNAVSLFNFGIENGASLDKLYGPKKASLTLAICSYSSKETSQIAFLEKLKKHKALDINMPNSIGRTPVIAAAQGCLFNLLKWLIKEGGEVNLKGGFNGTTPLISAIVNWSDKKTDNRLKTVEVLLDHGADINLPDTEHETPLMNAAFRGCLSVVRVLLQRGASVGVFDRKGQNAVNHAVLGAYDYEYRKIAYMNEPIKLQIIQLLAEYGADLNNVPDDGNPALIDAMLNGYMQLFTTLIDCGVDINVKNKRGHTALMIAKEFELNSFMRVLLVHQPINKMIH